MTRDTWHKYVFVQLMLALTPKWRNVCACEAYPWLHHRRRGKCGRGVPAVAPPIKPVTVDDFEVIDSKEQVEVEYGR